MFKQGLTFEAGYSELREPRKLLDVKVGEDHPITLAYGEIVRCISDVFAEELARAVPDILGSRLVFNPQQSGQDAKRRYELLVSNLKQVYRIEFGVLLEEWSRILGPKLQNHHSRVYDIVYELLLNAIEHGSDFGKLGSVMVKVFFGVDSVLCSIVQPKPLPNLYDRYKNIIDGGRNAPIHMQGSFHDARGRGAGMFNASLDFTPMVWFEQGTNVALIFEQAGRIEEINRCMLEESRKADEDAFPHFTRI